MSKTALVLFVRPSVTKWRVFFIVFLFKTKLPLTLCFFFIFFYVFSVRFESRLVAISQTVYTSKESGICSSLNWAFELSPSICLWHLRRLTPSFRDLVVRFRISAVSGNGFRLDFVVNAESASG